MKSLLKKSLCHNIFSFAWLRSLRKNIIDVSSFRELQCVAGKYISPAATSVPALDPVPALPVELVPLRGFFSFSLLLTAPFNWSIYSFFSYIENKIFSWYQRALYLHRQF